MIRWSGVEVVFTLGQTGIGDPGFSDCPRVLGRRSPMVGDRRRDATRPSLIPVRLSRRPRRRLQERRLRAPQAGLEALERSARPASPAPTAPARARCSPPQCHRWTVPRSHVLNSSRFLCACLSSGGKADNDRSSTVPSSWVRTARRAWSMASWIVSQVSSSRATEALCPRVLLCLGTPSRAKVAGVPPYAAGAPPWTYRIVLLCDRTIPRPKAPGQFRPAEGGCRVRRSVA